MRLGRSAVLARENIQPSSLKSDVPYVGLKHIAQETLHFLEIGSVSDVTSTKQRFYAGDILFGKLRPYFRKVVYPNFAGVCSTDIWVIRPRQGTDNRFLFYWCATWDFVNFVNSASEGTRMPRAKWEIAEKHQIPDFNLDEQRVIAHILGTLDDKIELNQKMRQTLEAIAKAVFKSWFVDFDPVRAKVEGRPTGLSPEISALFPDDLVESESGKMPRGWTITPLDSIGIFRNGLALQKYPYIKGQEKLPVVKIAQLRKGNTTGDELYASGVPKDYIIDDGDFIFSWSASLLAKYWVGNRGALNQHLFKVEGKGFPLWFISGWVQQYMPEFQSIAKSKATTMGHIKREHLKQALCTVPNSVLLEETGKIISPLIERAILAEQESRILGELRDTLLPKLISGELRVPDAEKFLKEAGI